jgi:prepilin-type N-terminal cleavage/methylation domain-containing protein
MADTRHDFGQRWQKLFTAMKGQQGITLVEVALAVAIIGILMAGALMVHERAQSQRQLQTTYDNRDMIVQALSIYIESAGRLPCPADPAATDDAAGWERGAPAGNPMAAGICDAKTREGIVPYMTLGLPRKTAMDGWGYFYTYAVSPVFVRKNDQKGVAADTGRVHGRCRHAGWINPGDHFNRNAIKARFCCVDQAEPEFDNDSDLIVVHTAGGEALSPVRSAGIKGNYDSLTKTAAVSIGESAVPIMDMSPVEAPSFVLVSHGPNHKGAWLGNGTDNRFNVPQAGVELKNADGDQVFVDGPWNLKPGPEQFDDIVRWMTQDGIIAAHGALSCSYP